MGNKDARVDAYIEKSAAFARPILRRLRTLVHRGCPEVVEEIKWGMPHFNYRGIFAGMAAFKTHCTFGFWNRAMNIDRKKGAMGQFGRITALADLPEDAVIVGYVREAKDLLDRGVKLGPVRQRRKAAARSSGADRRAAPEGRRAREVRGVLTEPEARLLGMDRRSEDRSDAG